MSGCCETSGTSCKTSRGFFTKEEKIEMLSEHKVNLEKEVKGISERIEELKKGS